jgi:hypothetical protein
MQYVPTAEFDSRFSDPEAAGVSTRRPDVSLVATHGSGRSICSRRELSPRPF